MFQRIGMPHVYHKSGKEIPFKEKGSAPHWGADLGLTAANVRAA